MTRVFPLPALARTSTGPWVDVTASRCASLGGARMASRTAAGTGMGANDSTRAAGGPRARRRPAGSVVERDRREQELSHRAVFAEPDCPLVRGPRVGAPSERAEHVPA